jgi:hypothetical protein
MDDLIIKGEKGTFFVPNVNFSAATGICELDGESYLEDTFAFYQPLIDWINAFAETQRPITLNVGLSYFNTASSRSILDLLLALKEYKDNGGEVKVNWSIKEWDEDMEMEVEDFAADSELDINMIKVS